MRKTQEEGREGRRALLAAGPVLCRCGLFPVRGAEFVASGQRRCAQCHTRADWGNSRRRLAREQSPEGKVQVHWRGVSGWRLRKIKEKKV